MLTCNKKYFNMVEIVLALAVVSIAIVSLMGVLPVALRASKNSVADNSVATVAEIMKVYIDNTYQNSTQLSDLYSNSNSIANTDSVFGGDFEQNFITPAQVMGLSNDLFPPGTFGGAFRIFNSSSHQGAYRVELRSGDNNQVTDFSALVQIWKENFNGDLYCPYNHTTPVATGATANVISSMPNYVAVTLVMRISYPAEATYANQEHRIYKFDYFRKMH